MHGLLIRSPWIEQILEGKKTWEIRGANTRIRGTIALIRSGSSQIVGTCELAEVLGPLAVSDMRDNISKHFEAQDSLLDALPYERTFAWVLRNAQRLPQPIRYKHPSGAVIWVKLPDPLFVKSEAD
jgi:hypothetical protein